MTVEFSGVTVIDLTHASHDSAQHVPTGVMDRSDAPHFVEDAEQVARCAARLQRGAGLRPHDLSPCDSPSLWVRLVITRCWGCSPASPPWPGTRSSASWARHGLDEASASAGCPETQPLRFEHKSTQRLGLDLQRESPINPRTHGQKWKPSGFDQREATFRVSRAADADPILGPWCTANRWQAHASTRFGPQNPSLSTQLVLMRLSGSGEPSTRSVPNRNQDRLTGRHAQWPDPPGRRSRLTRGTPARSRSPTRLRSR